MYRQNLLYGCSVLAFGVGLLIGLWIGSGFWAHCFGFGLVILGCSLMRRR